MNINALRNDFAKNYLKVSNKKAANVAKGDSPQIPEDTVSLSSIGSFCQKVSEAHDLTRQERVDNIKQDVDDGNYINDEKLSTALDSAIESALGGL